MPRGKLASLALLSFRVVRVNDHDPGSSPEALRGKKITRARVTAGLSGPVSRDFTLIHASQWDTPGMERFARVATTRSFYRGAKGVIVVYDVTNRVRLLPH